ncbi:MAG: fatty acid desaturase [Candidatus Marinimicrobia bacterium]|nr:fatty acid desaturase [Candidatus Neomarinimicrobiota bacterium]
MNGSFVPRAELAAVEWDPERKQWQRLAIEREALRALAERSTWSGLVRTGLFLCLLVGSAVLTMMAARISFWLAIAPAYLYFFFFGFCVAIGHELQHKTVFAPGFDVFSEVLFFCVQACMWNSPRYARISHRLHHRYTMVRGCDPETAWPEVITTRWLRGYLFRLVRQMLVVGAIAQLGRDVRTQVARAAGRQDPMMRAHCTAADIRVIRWESAAILAFHTAVVAAAIWFLRWEPIVFITLAWQIGSPFENLWHSTEHIGRLYNVNDQRYATRSVRVNRFFRLIYWGLDDHVDHHFYPIVPSCNLPKLHRLLQADLPEPKGMIACWREMFAIAREKDRQPHHEFVPVHTAAAGG